ncbi:MAG: hypothetical protein LBM93_10340 [Oscillospiraceae bacterium]|jgi:hypothetical protein|nr:hypothetical protein [Oscillospiraceae bacterium]
MEKQSISTNCHFQMQRQEIIGVLTAISVISKRMARKLTMLEKLNESEEKNVRKNKPPD